MTAVMSLPFNYIGWHYSRGTKDVFGMWKNAAWFVGRFFSVKLLFVYFFAPWRQLKESSHHTGFHPVEYLQNKLINILMRLVGVIIRLVTICIALVSWIVVGLGGALFIVIWLVYPVFLIGLFVASGVLIAG